MTSKDLENDKEFELFEELGYSDVVPFVLKNIQTRNWASYCYFTLNFLFLLTFLFMGIQGIKLQLISLGRLFFYFLMGLILVPLPLTIFHEAIHAAVYWIFGARNIRFGMNRKEFFFYVAADRYVTDFMTLLFVALSPFIILSSLLFVIFAVIPSTWALVVLAGIFSHGIMCIGDFAMLGFFLNHGPRSLYTFDKVEEGKAFFYKRKLSG